MRSNRLARDSSHTPTSNFARTSSFELFQPKVKIVTEEKDRLAAISTSIDFSGFWKKLNTKKPAQEALTEEHTKVEAFSARESVSNWRVTAKEKPGPLTASRPALAHSSTARTPRETAASDQSSKLKVWVEMQQLNIQKVARTFRVPEAAPPADLSERLRFTHQSLRSSGAFESVKRARQARDKTGSVGRAAVLTGISAFDGSQDKQTRIAAICRALQPAGESAASLEAGELQAALQAAEDSERPAGLAARPQTNQQSQELEQHLQRMKEQYESFLKKLADKKLTSKVPGGVVVDPSDFNEFYRLTSSQRIDKKLFFREPSEANDEDYNLVSIDSYGVGHSQKQHATSLHEGSANLVGHQPLNDWAASKERNRHKILRELKRKKGILHTNDHLKKNLCTIAARLKESPSLHEAPDSRSDSSNAWDSFCSNPLEGYTLGVYGHELYQKVFPALESQRSNNQPNIDHDYSGRFQKLTGKDPGARRRTTQLVSLELRFGKTKPHKHEFKMVPRLLFTSKHRHFCKAI